MLHSRLQSHDKRLPLMLSISRRPPSLFSTALHSLPSCLAPGLKQPSWARRSQASHCGSLEKFSMENEGELVLSSFGRTKKLVSKNAGFLAGSAMGMILLELVLSPLLQMPAGSTLGDRALTRPVALRHIIPHPARTACASFQSCLLESLSSPKQKCPPSPGLETQLGLLGRHFLL